MRPRSGYVLLAIAWGCSSSSITPTDDRGAHGGGASAGGSGSAQAGAGGPLQGEGGTLASGGFSCAPPALQTYGVRFDAARGCLDTATKEPVACATGEAVSRAQCFERIGDGERYWVFTQESLTADPVVWRTCPGADEPPKPCFAVQCDQAPSSLCTPAETRLRFGCGSPDSEWDAGCCRRRACDGDRSCLQGERCVEMATIAGRTCFPFPGSGGTCDCSSSLGGLTQRLCVSD